MFSCPADEIVIVLPRDMETFDHCTICPADEILIVLLRDMETFDNCTICLADKIVTVLVRLSTIFSREMLFAFCSVIGV